MIEVSASFELQGEFSGFFKDVFGKRRMVLRVNGEEMYLKVPKSLRHELDGTLQSGQGIVVTGTESFDRETGREKRVVLQVRISGRAECVSCPIRVCVKKSCWRNGGRELWAALERKVEEAGLGESVKLKAVNCLDHCKRGPNAEIAGRDFHRCRPQDVGEILEYLTGHEV